MQSFKIGITVDRSAASIKRFAVFDSENRELAAAIQEHRAPYHSHASRTFRNRLGDAQAAGYVTLTNDAHPWAPIEAGNNVSVAITGAAPYGLVTVTENGGAPFYFGTTDGSGNWLITVTEDSSYIGDYTQHWYVNGFDVTPSNPNDYYFPYAPSLPFFSVYANYAGGPTNCPGVLSGHDSCDANNTVMAWKWSPIAYYNDSSLLSPQGLDNAASSWNDVQSVLALAPSTANIDVVVFQSSTTSSEVGGFTTFASQECDTDCYGQIDQCTGACMDSGALYYSEIYLNSDVIPGIANAYQMSADSVSTVIAKHELGHSLRLSHPSNVVSHVCTEVQSIMYPDLYSSLGCQPNPTAYCDGQAVNNAYPDPPLYCPQGDDYCDGETCTE